MSLSEDSRKDMVRYRIEKAWQTFDDAEFAADNRKYHMAANRLYYAAYHAVSALLLSDNLQTKTHKGLHLQFDREFVETGICDINDGKLIRVLFNMRHEDDYEDYKEVTEQQIRELLPRVRAFIGKLVRLNKLARHT